MITIMKKLLLLILFLALHFSNSYSQQNEFLVGIYDYDAAGNYIYPPGTDPAVGNDLAFLTLLANQNFNFVEICQLVEPTKVYASSFPSRSFLDNAESLKLKVILDCPEIRVDRTIPSYNSAQSQQALNYYGNHPSLIGFSAGDEPGTPQFPYINSY